MVFYRKYRPQTLDDLLGQETVKDSLKSALGKQNFAHAYLFCGPKGTGKTSTARILAKILNCESTDPDKIPCNLCASCQAISDGSSLDVIEMDAASNRGIEDIRSLRENIKLAPSSAQKKVYIIDEAHMLTGEAFNALLKTLEEPPSHVVFILATTDPQKVPQTILSRVQRLDFKMAPQDDIITALKNIADKEKLEIDETSLQMIAKKASGSFRDAEKYLDQLSSFGKITPEIVERVLGLSGSSEILDLIENLAQAKAKEVLEKINKLVSQGAAVKELNLALLDYLRQLLLIKNGLDSVVKRETSEEMFTKLSGIADKFDLMRLLKSISILQTSLDQLRYVTIPILPLEVAVVESCLQVQPTVVEIKAETPQSKIIVEAPKTDIAESNLNFVAKADVVSADNLSVSESVKSEDIQKILERWTYVLETVRQNNFSLEALLRSSKIAECTQKNLVIAVPYSFHQRILDAAKSKNLLEAIFSDILERPIKISTVVVPKPMGRDDIANVEVAQDDEIVRMAAEIFNSEVN